MNKVIKASGNSVEAYWPTLFAKALNTTNVGELLQNVITAGPAAGPAARDAQLAAYRRMLGAQRAALQA